MILRYEHIGKVWSTALWMLDTREKRDVEVVIKCATLESQNPPNRCGAQIGLARHERNAVTGSRKGMLIKIRQWPG